jgi:hypothetical protein
MPIVNDKGYPEILMDALRVDTYSRGDSDVSATELIRAPRQAVLERRHGKEYPVPASSLLKSFLGTAMHNAVERKLVRTPNKPYLTERRFYKEIDGVIVSGMFDMYLDGVLWDLKTTSVWKKVFAKGSVPEWDQQINIYAMLMREQGLRVDKANILAWYTDWDERKAGESADYPMTNVEEIPITLWDDETVNHFLEQRVYLFKSSMLKEDNDLPLCTPDEMWLKPAQYAVRANGAQRATRVFRGDTAHADAKAFFESSGCTEATHSIEQRLGEPSKCINFCKGAPYCNQYANYCASVQAA